MSSDKESTTRRKISLTWTGVLLAAALAVGCGVWATRDSRQPEGARTVAEAIGGGVKQKQDSTVDFPASVEGERVISLAASLGIPLESIPRGIYRMDSGATDSREQLRSAMLTAIKNGTLTVEEAQGVMNAFDAGLIEPNVEGFVAESAPEH